MGNRQWWIVGGIAVLILAWFGLKDTIYRASLEANTPASPDPLDYTSVDSWAAFPEVQPPGAWETPWGVDVFLIAPPTGVASVPGLVNARSETHQERFDASVTELSRAIAKGAPVYAPHYHAPSAVSPRGANAEQVAAGLTAAFDTYVNEHNLDRAVLLAIDERALPFADPILARLTETDMAERFAGRVVFGENLSGAVPARCNPSLENTCEQTVDMRNHSNAFSVVLPRLRGRIGRRSVIDADGTADAISVQMRQVSAWLDENAPKPAEPLGDFEEIEIAPVYRPDEAISD